MKFLLILLLCINIAFAQDGYSTQEQSIFQETLQETTEELTLDEALVEEAQNKPKIIEKPIKNEPEEVFEEDNYAYLFKEVPFDANNKQSNSIYAKFVTYPTSVYTSQRFAVEIEALITSREYTKIETRFLNSKDISVINPQNDWVKSVNNSYKNLYFFKVNTQAFQLPTFQIILYNKNSIVDVIYLKPNPISYTNIAIKDNQFSNVIANDVKVLSSKTKQYSNTELLTVLEIEANYGNLEDFRLKEFGEQLLMSLEENYPNQKLIYNTIVPIYTKEIKFNYYNTQTKQFKKLVVPIKLEQELVSTQTDLNPNDSNIEMYKKVALGVLTIFFLLLFLLKRKNTYIVIAIILSIVFFFFTRPNNLITLSAATKIFILPTNNSTVFYIAPTEQVVETLDKKGEFIKVLFKLNDQNSKTVGWIKEEDVVKN
jgi:hypothetical protein